jgi:hypothetical protein
MLTSGYYQIPRFQRPYSWEREHIQEFWNDVIRDQPDNYFIGSMVLFKAGKQRYGVVDGQQRLTTICIFLSVLRDVLREQDQLALAQGIHGLVERKNLEHVDEYILSTESSFPYFQSQIQAWDKHELDNTQFKEENNLASAYDQIRDLIYEVVNSVANDPSLTVKKKQQNIVARLTEIRDSLLKLSVIRVMLDNEDDAYVIFETLNTRGKDLRLSDLVKNHLTRHLKTKNASVDPIREKWQGLVEVIQGSAIDLDLDAFIHHFWLSRYDYITSKQLYKELKKIVTKSKATEFLTALNSDAKLYRSMHDLGYVKWLKEEKPIANSLRALNMFRVKQQVPWVLSLLRAYRLGTIKLRHVSDALEAVERFHFLFTAITSQRSSGGISFMYASSGRRLSASTQQTQAVDLIKELKGKLIGKLPSRDEFLATFSNLIYTDEASKQKSLMRYTLIGLYPATPSVPPDFDQMTIEHLRPQSDINRGTMSADLIGQIGNLVLVPKELNGKLDNKTFLEKKKLLLASDYKLDNVLLEAKEMTEDVIVARTKLLGEQAFDRIWHI